MVQIIRLSPGNVSYCCRPFVCLRVVRGHGAWLGQFQSREVSEVRLPRAKRFLYEVGRRGYTGMSTYRPRSYVFALRGLNSKVGIDDLSDRKIMQQHYVS